MTTTTKRRVEILQLLPRRKTGTITVPTIIDRLKERGIFAEKRAIERDMVELRLDFPIDCDKSSKPYQWYWDIDEALSIPYMGQFTALTFHLAEEILKPLLPAQSLDLLQPNFSTAKTVLDEVSKRRTRSWLKKIRAVPRSLRLLSAPIRNGIYDTVTQALYEDKQIEMTYLAGSSDSGKPKTYAVHPYALLHRDTITELIGRMDNRSEILRWSLHRIEAASILNAKSIIPSNFDLDNYIERDLAHPLSGQLIKFKAWVSKKGQAHVLETRLSEDQKIEYVEDGLIISATVRETIELKWWLLGLGERVEVLTPASLRNEIKETLQAAAKLYK
jgi:predicted DNA-binding transcriptional regulator YafY